MAAVPSTSSESVCSGLNSDSVPMNVQICPTTGGKLDLQITQTESVDSLKRNIGKKLKVPRERISLLFRDRILKEGTMAENGISDGCKITLLPNVESGLMSQKQENSVMQALENLTEGQVHEFLEGRAPLTLAMRVGDHMMLVQLQLSTTQLNAAKRSSRPGSSSHHITSSPPLTSLPIGSSPPTMQRSSPSMPTMLPTMSRMSPNWHSPKPSSPMPGSVNASNHIADSGNIPILDSVTLEAASRNLHQRLRELSQISSHSQNSENCPAASNSNVPTTGTTAAATSAAPSTPHPSPPTPSPTTSPSTVSSSTQGAIIESMHHHGQGVYSGTFSGTLNPALQDRSGKPKRSVSTIIHILNDLLGAAPQVRTPLSPRSENSRHYHHPHQYKHHHHHQKMKPQMMSTARSNRSIGEQIRLSQENQTTRSKMEQLHMMLEERRQRRRARREARSSPYSSWHLHGDESLNNDSSMEVDANVETTSVADVSESKYNELTQETMVV